MRKLASNECIADNEDVTSPEEENISDETSADILLPDLDPERTYRVLSPRLANSEQAKDFVQEVIIEETSGAS